MTNAPENSIIMIHNHPNSSPLSTDFGSFCSIFVPQPVSNNKAAVINYVMKYALFAVK